MEDTHQVTGADNGESLMDLLLGVLTDDLAYPAWISADAANLVESREDQRTVAVGVAAWGILSGLVVPGQLCDGGFEPLPGTPASQVVVVAQDWFSWPGFPDHADDVCWFAGTESGLARGRQIVEARGPGDWDDDVWGSGDLANARSAMSGGSLTLRKLLDAVDVEGALPQDRRAMVLGLVIEAVLSGQPIVAGADEDLGAAIVAVFDALEADADLILTEGV